YFEAAAVITTLVLLGQVLELRARHRTGGAIRALLGLAPKTARRIAPDGREEDVPLAQVRVGDRLRVRPGEKVPVDGVVVEGRGSAPRRPWPPRWPPRWPGSSSPARARSGSRPRCRSWSASGEARPRACSSSRPRRWRCSSGSTRWWSTRRAR